MSRDRSPHHSRQNSAISTSSVIRSSGTSHSPSPCASPISPTVEGLSRRLSWNRPREEGEGLSVQDAHSVINGSGSNNGSGNGHGHLGSGTSSPRYLDAVAHPLEELDIGIRHPLATEIRAHDHNDHDNDIISNKPMFDSPQPQPLPHSHPKLFVHQSSSQTSFESITSELDTPPDEDKDIERLTFAPAPGGGSSSAMGQRHRRMPSKAYDENGNPREAGIHQRVAGAVSRSNTFRNVSRTIRQASVRMVNIMGTDETSRGRVRLDDPDERPEDSESGKGTETPLEDLGAIHVLENQARRPDPMPPEGGLRGRTLGMFGPRSRTRIAMNKLMRYPWTEPLILLLIITNVVVLILQSASSLNTPREDDGYFHSWEDFVLLALFIVFTLEMFARIVTTGLFLDPDITLRQFFFSPAGLIPRLTSHLRQAQSSLQRVTSRKATPTASWKSYGGPTPTIPPPKRKTTLMSEAPFRKALAKQQSLSAQGRPYLRHSWHRIDMIAVIAFWITFLLSITGQEATAQHHIYIFRALSVLRAGRLLVITSGTTTILHSLKRAGPLLITVSFFLIFAFSLFSIIGVQSFRGSFRRQCVYTDPFNSSNQIQLSQTCGGHVDGSNNRLPYLELDGTPTEVSPKGYICPVNQVCQTTEANPNGDSNSFDNVFASLVQVIIITSINTWAPVMYMAMDSDYFASSLYFLVAVIILNFWFINLLTAVVVNTFKDIRAETRRSAFGANDGVGGGESQWATGNSKRKDTGRLLVIYEKTQLFWVLLALTDLVAQACKTAHSSDSTLDLLKNLELAFTFAFDLEMLIRIAAHFPNWRLFFSRGRNSFDLFLVVSSSIIQIPAIVSSRVYPWLTIFQVLRWYRVILAFPRMRPLLITVFGSVWGLLNMVIFLFLINLIGALVAVQLFRGDLESGNTITFAHTYNAFLGMYQIFSSENWTDVMYDTMSAEIAFKQRWIAAAFLCGWFLFSNAVVLQMFIAVINENFAVAEEQKRKRQIEEFIRKTEPVSAHVSWIDRLNPYRLMSANRKAVKVDTLPPNLVLPLKQNVGPDVGALPTKYSKRNEATGAKGAMQRLLGRNDEAKQLIPLRDLKGSRSAKFDEHDNDFDDDRGLSDLLPPLNAGPSADEHMDVLRERRNQQADFITAHPSFDQSLWLFKQSNPLRRFCQACVSPAYGERIFGRPAKPLMRLAVKAIVFLAIVASIVVAAIATPEYRREYYTQHGLHRGTWFDLVEVGLGTTFILEALIKIIADGFMFAPNAYLLSLWNVLDFLMLIALLVNTTTSLIYIGGLSRVTRALKGFRALRLITLFGRLRDTLYAVLFAGALKILDASILMVLYLIPFAVWGLNIFSGLLYSCNDSDQSGLTDCTGSYFATPVDDSLPYLVPRVWANPSLDQSKWSFDSFRESILILFEIVSLEGWIDVMASVMNITGRDLQPDTNASQWNAIFFLLFNLFGGVIILTLFLSVIIGNFSTRSGDALLTREQRHWVDLHKFIKAQTPSQLPKLRPQGGFRAWCYERATNKHGYWMRGFTLIYYIHILLLMTEDFSNNILTDQQADWIFLFLTMLYAFDLLVRFYGLGFKSFRANGWNLFDVIVITGSFATTIPALRAANQGRPGSQVNVQLQKLFLVAIAFKLVQRIGSLNQLFKTSVASLPAIGNLFLLWATIFLFFAILFIEVFGLTKIGNNAGTRFQNYYSFGNALVMLAFMSTGEGWNGYMHDYTVSYPRCTESESYFNSDCGSSAWAYGLFLSWNIISMYIFLNMFTGVVVESFAYVYQMPGGASLNREEMRSFKKLWAEFDTERTGYIKRKDFIKFFARLSGVFEVRLYPAEYSIPNLLRAAVPDPVANSSGKLLVVTGVKRAVDIRRVENLISHIDYRLVRQRRQLFARLYHEARISEEPGRGIGFTAMLMMLAHNKLINDEKALMLDDLLVRREKTDRVTDLVNLDRVRGLLRTIYWRRRFLASRDERRRTLNAEAEGIPAIILEPTPATPPYDDDPNPFNDARSRDIEMSRSPSPPGSRGSSPGASPQLRPSASPLAVYTPDVNLGAGLGHGHSPSLSVGGTPRPSLGRTVSNSSMLSSDDAHYRGQSPVDDGPPSPIEGYMESMANSMWGDMMREAVDEEEE